MCYNDYNGIMLLYTKMMKENYMENYCYYSFHNVPCILIERLDRITLIPCKKDDYKNLFKFFHDTDYKINYSGGIYEYKHAFIHKQLHNFESIDLYPDYIIHSISQKISSMEITGPAVDDFFSPSTYFFYKSRNGNKNIGDILYNSKDDVADKWIIDYKGSKITITLYYGGLLRRGIASDLILHPRLKIEFEETTDYDYLFSVYNAINRFFEFILYKSECGKYNVELFGMIDDKYSSIGYLFDCKLMNATYDKQIGRICYSDYKEYIPAILQFVFDDPSLCLKHLPKYGVRDWERDDIELLYTQLFTAFENECRKQRDKYDRVDDSSIKNTKTELIDIIEGFSKTKTNYTAKEKKFISDSKQRILQLGTQFGQKARIVNAYSMLSSSIENLLPYILFLHKEYRSSTKLTDKQINDIAKKLTEMRGAIVHGGDHTTISREDCQLINFFEVLIYAQMLDRARIPLPDIKMIISSTLFQHYDLFDRAMKEFGDYN